MISKSVILISLATAGSRSLNQLKTTWMAKENSPCLFISAIQNEGMEELRKAVYEVVRKIHVTRFPYNDFLYDLYEEDQA